MNRRRDYRVVLKTGRSVVLDDPDEVRLGQFLQGGVWTRTTKPFTREERLIIAKLMQKKWAEWAEKGIEDHG